MSSPLYQKHYIEELLSYLLHAYQKSKFIMLISYRGKQMLERLCKLLRVTELVTYKTRIRTHDPLLPTLSYKYWDFSIKSRSKSVLRCFLSMGQICMSQFISFSSCKPHRILTGTDISIEKHWSF